MKFSIVATFSGGPVDGYIPCDICVDDVSRILCESFAADLSVDETEPGDSEYCYLADECEGSDSEFWAKARDITVSGIVDRPDFFDFFDRLCSYAENVETLGTLGGPANTCGLSPDISVCLESQYTVASIRVTPLPERGAMNEKNWRMIRRAFLNLFGIHKVDREFNNIPQTYPDAWREFRRDI